MRSQQQLSFLWTAIGSWSCLFCVDSVWVMTGQESFAPVLGALDDYQIGSLLG